MPITPGRPERVEFKGIEVTPPPHASEVTLPPVDEALVERLGRLREAITHMNNSWPESWGTTPGDLKWTGSGGNTTGNLKWTGTGANGNVAPSDTESPLTDTLTALMRSIRKLHDQIDQSRALRAEVESSYRAMETWRATARHLYNLLAAFVSLYGHDHDCPCMSCVELRRYSWIRSHVAGDEQADS